MPAWRRFAATAWRRRSPASPPSSRWSRSRKPRCEDGRPVHLRGDCAPLRRNHESEMMKDEQERFPIPSPLLSFLRIRHPSFLPLLWLLGFLLAYVSLKSAFGILTCDDAYITLGHV